MIVYLKKIFIYTKNSKQAYVKINCSIFDIISKYRLFIYLKRCYFYKNKVFFLGYIVLIDNVRIEDKKIKIQKLYKIEINMRYISIFSIDIFILAIYLKFW